MGPDWHHDLEASCSERGHYRHERPRPGVPDGDVTGSNGRSLVFPNGDMTGQNGRGLVLSEGDITGQNGRGLVFSEGDITGPSGRGLVFPRGTLQARDPQHGFRRVGTVGF